MNKYIFCFISILIIFNQDCLASEINSLVGLTDEGLAIRINPIVDWGLLGLLNLATGILFKDPFEIPDINQPSVASHKGILSNDKVTIKEGRIPGISKIERTGNVYLLLGLGKMIMNGHFGLRNIVATFKFDVTTKFKHPKDKQTGQPQLFDEKELSNKGTLKVDVNYLNIYWSAGFEGFSYHIKNLDLIPSNVTYTAAVDGDTNHILGQTYSKLLFPEYERTILKATEDRLRTTLTPTLSEIPQVINLFAQGFIEYANKISNTIQSTTRVFNKILRLKGDSPFQFLRNLLKDLERIIKEWFGSLVPKAGQ